MADDIIRFRRIDADSDIVAVAEVPLYRGRGIYLRGWNIVKRGDDIEVLPPYKVYTEPQTGAKRTLPLLFFEREEEREKWIHAVKEEFLKWEKREGASPPITPQKSKDIRVWDHQKEIAEKEDDIG